MSKKKSRQQNKSTPPAQTGVMTRDAFQNALARMGWGMPSMLEGTDYPLTRLTKNYQLMNSLYRSHWVIRRIIDVIPEDMCKNWYTIQSQIRPDYIDRLSKMERQTRVKSKILEGLKWGRLYGGAAAVIMIEGHEGILDQPLDYDTIMPGAFKGLLVLDRWSGIYPELQLVTDPSDPEFGLPDMYQVTSEAIQGTIRIHHSRILRFIARELPYWERQAEVYWGASEIEHVFDELKKRDNTSWNIANLVFRANLVVLGMEGMDQVFAVGNQKVQNDLYNTIQAQNWLMNNFSMFIKGSQDTFDSKQYTFSGLSDIYENFMMDVAGAAEIPVTKLFGRSPAGMNATGESDMQNYYDTIEEKQEAHLGPILDKLLPIMCVSEFGAIPDDLDYKFNPVRRPSDNEKTDLASKTTDAIINVYNAGLASERLALKELRQSSDMTGLWTNITDEDIERASDTAQTPGEDLTGLVNSLNFNNPSVVLPTTDGGEGSGNFGHEGRPGQIGGSGGGGTAKVDPLGANRFSKGFSEHNLKVHMARHGKQYPGMSEKEYEKRALELIQKPVEGDIEGYANSKGQIVRYDKENNDFVKGKPDLGIATMFKPQDGIKYFIRQKEGNK